MMRPPLLDMLDRFVPKPTKTPDTPLIDNALRRLGREMAALARSPKNLRARTSKPNPEKVAARKARKLARYMRSRGIR